VFFTNSIGYAMESTSPNAQVKCGEWIIETASLSNDKRLGVTLSQQAAGSDCHGIFTLKNQTGTFLGGAYALGVVQK
jgi:hypothetical protein